MASKESIAPLTNVCLPMDERIIFIGQELYIVNERYIQVKIDDIAPIDEHMAGAEIWM